MAGDLIKHGAEPGTALGFRIGLPLLVMELHTRRPRIGIAHKAWSQAAHQQDGQKVQLFTFFLFVRLASECVYRLQKMVAPVASKHSLDLLLLWVLIENFFNLFDVRFVFSLGILLSKNCPNLT